MLGDSVKQFGAFAQQFDISFFGAVQQVGCKKVVEHNKPLFYGFSYKFIHFGENLIQRFKRLIRKREYNRIFQRFHGNSGWLPGNKAVVGARKCVFGKKIGGKLLTIFPAI